MVRRDAGAHEAERRRQEVEQVDLEALREQLLGRVEARGTGADDGDAAPLRRPSQTSRAPFITWNPIRIQGTKASTRAGLPVPPTSLSGATTTSAPVGGSSREVGELRDAVLAGAEEVRVDGERRVEAAGRAGVGADGLDADPDDRRLLGQPARALGVGPGGARRR